MKPSVAARLFELLLGFFAALGMIALAGLVGLYFGGFFHFLADKHPGSAVLQFFFGA